MDEMKTVAGTEATANNVDAGDDDDDDDDDESNPDAKVVLLRLRLFGILHLSCGHCAED